LDTLSRHEYEAINARGEQTLKDIVKQKNIPKKYKFPTFDCPNPKCDAKRILFAGDAVSKNETVLSMLKETGIADYVIICPKCKQYIAVRRNEGKEKSEGVYFYTANRGVSFMYHLVYNHRIRGIYSSYPQNELVFQGVLDQSGSDKQEEKHGGSATYYPYGIPQPWPY